MRNLKTRIKNLQQSQADQQGKQGIIFYLPRMIENIDTWAATVNKAHEAATKKEKELHHERTI